MPGFEERSPCRAPAEEVWKLLYDPSRLPEWWAGMDRVEVGGDGDVTRYMAAWPDFPYPTRISREASGRVVISCLLSDIVHEWTLEPAEEGCIVGVRVEIPEEEAARLDAQREEVATSLARLIARAEAMA
jgi:uncharacterized protein YndB with AHSA1/START domain